MHIIYILTFPLSFTEHNITMRQLCFSQTIRQKSSTVEIIGP
ncbi:unnamed protein product [Schistosoma curassoni]|uniref:Uncharacterized protein n=1 Tax=Schistosoma curassoni TaxID=6186 RepID=A0A183K3C6_9TREM|nr:unnamed protein product [Schistosoma curassoni]